MRFILLLWIVPNLKATVLYNFKTDKLSENARKTISNFDVCNFHMHRGLREQEKEMTIINGCPLSQSAWHAEEPSMLNCYEYRVCS